jgi:hypothetical protein
MGKRTQQSCKKLDRETIMRSIEVHEFHTVITRRIYLER